MGGEQAGGGMIRKVFVIKSESRYLKPLRNKLNQFLKRIGFTKRDRQMLLIAVGEVCTNAIRHAYRGERGRKIRVSVIDSDRKTVFRIRDYGHKIKLSKVKTPKLPPTKPHGLGIYLVKTIADELKYNNRHARGNEFILTKYKREKRL